MTLLLAGCASEEDNQRSVYSLYAHLVKESFKATFHSSRITREEAAAVPYASLGYRVGNDSEAMLVLATVTGDDEIWTAKSHVVLQLNKGRIKRSVGLAHDLGGAAGVSHGGNLPAPSEALTRPFQSIRTLDFADMDAYSVTIRCRAARAGIARITVLGAAIQTVRVDETCRSSFHNWEFTDQFWIDPQTKFVWRSVQTIHPQSKPITIEILRPPG